MSRLMQVCIPFSRITVVHALRSSPAAFRVLSQITYTPSVTSHVPRHASFSTTPLRRASEDPQLQTLVDQQQKMLRVMQDKPELVKVVKEFAEALRAEGVDTQSGTVPSKMQMLGLFMKPSIREGAMNIFTAFKEAGIDLDSKDMLEAFMAMKKSSEDTK